MKRVRIASGIKRVDDSDRNTAMFKFRDLLSEHRNVLILRVLSDLATYIDYKFQMKVPSRELETVKDNLHQLRNSVIDLERYGDMLDHFMEHDMTYVGIEPFFREIDDSIASSLNVSQLKLV